MATKRKPRAQAIGSREGAKIGSRIRPVSKVSISEDIAQQILDLISSGALKPGQRLPSERELCKHFGAARSSLREALRGLSMYGVLTARVGEGTSVAADGGKFLGRVMEWRVIAEKHDIENLLEVRIALESIAAANMALHGTDEEIERLGTILARMKSSLKDRVKYAAADLDFHVTVAQSSGNSLLIDLIGMIRNQLANALAKLLLPHVLPISLKEHEPVFRAIERRDPVAARNAMQAHLEKALERHRATMDEPVTTEPGPAKKPAKPSPRKPATLPKPRSTSKTR